MPIRIKNWKRFQHFRIRRPPWIKLYRDLLDDIEWHELDPASAKTLTMLWLIASEHDGCLPCVKELAFRLRMTEKQVESTVSKLQHWLEQDDIAVISPRYQNDLSETETETETETEKIGVSRPKGNGRFTPPTLDEVSQFCKDRGNAVDAIKFHAFYSSKGWRVGKVSMKNWQACVVTWERSN